MPCRCGAVGVQRAWDRKDLAYPAFDTKALKTPLTLDNGLTLKFGAKGKVTVGDKGKFVVVQPSN